MEADHEGVGSSPKWGVLKRAGVEESAAWPGAKESSDAILWSIWWDGSMTWGDDLSRGDIAPEWLISSALSSVSSGVMYSSEVGTRI